MRVLAVMLRGANGVNSLSRGERVLCRMLSCFVVCVAVRQRSAGAGERSAQSGAHRDQISGEGAHQIANLVPPAKPVEGSGHSDTEKGCRGSAQNSTLMPLVASK